ncbi:S8 family serine peptidase [Xanthomonas sp. LF06-19]|uniref:S8 family peptidase n=1 Tax=Xanthomonas sp. LF06-19 TaxID=3097551 RepID=UPI002A807041|nr:S8 family serine peptidase [Xanthomonas sp. LF06-19]MDY4284186.1 S8 family serine peptidase [Xanthomonas sp. LF06-19]
MSGTMFAKKRLSALVRLGALIGLALSSSVHAQAPTNDPLSAQQWNLSAIRAPQAWVLAPANGQKIRIATIDSGYSGHPDITWAQDGSGRDFYRGINGGNPNEDGGFAHGTHTAGIIGAKTQNGQGIAGVCPQCEILSSRIYQGVSDANLAAAIKIAVQSGARVVNLSLADPTSTCDDYQYTNRAISQALVAGVSIVASAGNHNAPGIIYDQAASGSWVDVAHVRPASCPGVISVGATDQMNLEAPYTNGGASLTLMAPGGGATRDEGVYGAGLGDCPGIVNPISQVNAVTRVGVLSAWAVKNGDGLTSCYRFLSGTSMSAPHVSGAIGLMLSANPALTPDQIKNILKSTATPMACADNRCGAGLLNAEAAVNWARSMVGNGKIPGPCLYNFGDDSLRPTACVLDAIDEGPHGTESVIAYGHLWKFDTQGQPSARPAPLSAVPRYAAGNGPCTQESVGSHYACKFETRTEVDYPGVGYLESITAYGRYWNFDANGQPFGPQGGELKDVPRYAAGPCQGKNPCVFDTRSLVVFPEWGGLVESVNAYGQYWMWDANGNLLASGPLQSVARYQQICNYGPAGTPCKFDTRELKSNRHEVITAYGRYFEFNGETLIQNTALADMPRFN